MHKDNFRTIVFYCFKFGMGGTETLILRLMEFYKDSGNRVILLTETAIDEGIFADTERIEFEHYIYDAQRSKFCNLGAELRFSSNEAPLVITQFMPEFLKCYTLLKKTKYNVEVRHLLYILHPHSTFYGPKRLKILARKMIISLLKNRALVFMDETCIEECVKYYRLPVSMNYPIFRLPIFIKEDTHSKTKNEVFNILSICRYEFPFKGYLLGLIKTFDILHKKYENISLTIIGYGPGSFEVDALIQSLPQAVKEKLTLLKKVQYNQIHTYIKACDVYVGMGTTVLDAANLNKIVITAVAYQKADLAVGFFHENYKTIGEVYQHNNSYPVFKDLIESVINSDNEQFNKMSNMSKVVLTDNYNISNIANKILDHTLNPLTYSNALMVNFLANIHLISTFLIKKIKH